MRQINIRVMNAKLRAINAELAAALELLLDAPCIHTCGGCAEGVRAARAALAKAKQA